MRHLTLEFSSENLLFIIECKQLSSLMNIEIPALKDIYLPKELPLSHTLNNLIKYKNMSQSKIKSVTNIKEILFYKTCKDLYIKYIRPGTALCINIDYDSRMECINVFESTDDTLQRSDYEEQASKVSQLFSGLARQVEGLIFDSWNRYRRTYKVLREIQGLSLNNLV